MSILLKRGEALPRLLDAAENSSPVQAVEAVTRELGSAMGASDVSFLIVDLSGRALVRLAHVPLIGHTPGDDTRDGAERRSGEETATVLPFDGGPAEQTLRTQLVQVLPPGGKDPNGHPNPYWTVLAPVTERGEAIGLLELSLPGEPSEKMVSEIARTAHLLAFVVIANRRHTDLFEWGQRSTPFNLYAEIQRRLLPASFTCEAGAFTLSAWLEPAATIGGDTFDYSLDRDTLHLSVTDAMGHGLASALTATLCVGSLRNTRRRGLTLLEQAAAANTALSEYAERVDSDGYATGLLGRLDLRTGILSLVNAGHTAPFLARSGADSLIELPPCMPLGMFPDSVYTSTDLALEPGDRLVTVTDGMLDRRAAALDLAAEVSKTRHLHPRETTRRLADAVIGTAGPTLEDDATMLVLDWYGHHDRDRNTDAGANSSRAEADELPRLTADARPWNA